MLRVTFMDGGSQEMEREGILGVIPCANLFRHPQLKADAVFYENGKIYPLLGPLPAPDERAWILLFATHGQVIADLPTFDDDAMPTPVEVAAVPESEEEYLLRSA